MIQNTPQTAQRLRGKLLLFRIIQNFLGNIDRSILTLLKDSANILADDSDTEQLNTAEQKQKNNNGSVSRNGNSPDQFFDDDPDQVENGGDSGNAAQNGGKPKRGSGETDNSLDCVLHQLPEAPLCGAGGSFAGGVGDKFGFIPDPRKQALGKTVIFPKG